MILRLAEFRQDPRPADPGRVFRSIQGSNDLGPMILF